MKKNNIIDFFMYHNRDKHPASPLNPPMSEELKTAIQHLIDRMRTCQPIK